MSTVSHLNLNQLESPSINTKNSTTLVPKSCKILSPPSRVSDFSNQPNHYLIFMLINCSLHLVTYFVFPTSPSTDSAPAGDCKMHFILKVTDFQTSFIYSAKVIFLTPYVVFLSSFIKFVHVTPMLRELVLNPIKVVNYRRVSLLLVLSRNLQRINI